MLVAVSGSQGSGKTTVIQELHKLGYPIITRKTSRSILDEWGVSLSQVNNDRDLTTKFQDEIIKRKFQDELEAMKSSEIVFTERTYADLFSYALVALGKDNEYDAWMNRYYQRCMTLQASYDAVFYLTAGHFTIQADGVRASNKHYSTMVDLVMKEFTEQMTPGLRLNVVDTPVLQERTAIINVKTQSVLNRPEFLSELMLAVES